MATVTWKATGIEATGDLDIDANWDTGAKPVAGDTAVIPASSNKWPTKGTCLANTVTNNGTIEGGTWSGTGTLTDSGTIKAGTFNINVLVKSGAGLAYAPPVFNGTLTFESGSYWYPRNTVNRVVLASAGTVYAQQNIIVVED